MPVTTTNIDLHPLYGIIATQKSYLIGIRCLIATHHAQMMASRILPPDFPDELVSALADRLADLAELRIRSLWDTSSDWDGRLQKFGIAQMVETGGRTPAERATMDQLKNLNVAVIPIAITKAGGKSARWVHLSAASIRPQLYSNNPSARPASIPGTMLPTQRDSVTSIGSGLRARCRLDIGTHDPREQLNLNTHTLTVHSILLDQPLLPLTLNGLVQLDRLEEAIRTWQKEDFEKFVKLPKLRVVATAGEEGGGLVAKLRLLHIVMAK
ncbi:hypothetical protein LTR95_010122 [Oleoguttula sp. CCFEE 5521]